MNALPIPQPPEFPNRRRRPQSTSQARHRRQRHHRVLAAEASVKLGVNIVISTAAIAALAQLLPYSGMQQAKLKEIQTEVKTSSVRVDKLKAEFNRYFDPRQAKLIVQEQTNLAEPNQKKLVWDDSAPASAQLP
jgi:outer membrane murein-binding lipoprotein Lpp